MNFACCCLIQMFAANVNACNHYGNSRNTVLVNKNKQMYRNESVPILWAFLKICLSISLIFFEIKDLFNYCNLQPLKYMKIFTALYFSSLNFKPTICKGHSPMKRPLLLRLYQCSFWDEKIRSPNKIPMVSRVDIKVTAIFIRALSILFKPKKKRQPRPHPNRQ